MLRRPHRIATAAALAVAAVLPCPAAAQDAEALCHFTGTGYVRLMVDDSALIDHLAHDEDIFPAPEEGCPAGAAPTPAATATATPGPAGYPLPTGTATPEVEEFPIAGPDDGGDGDAAPGQAPSEPTPPAAAGRPLAPQSPRLAQARALAAGRLPATGDDVRLILLAGFGLVLAGAGLRLQVR